MDLSAFSGKGSHKVHSPGPTSGRHPEITSSTRLLPGTETKAKFVVELRPRPKYVPGSGPALQPVRLLPPTTSTAYIIERILLPSPGLAADGKPLSKRMTYIVGWHDLPAASLLVPAMEILDYVSPRVLEDWEERLQDELDGERDKLAREGNAPVGTPTEPKNKKSRPPTHTEIEDAVAIEPEPEAPGDVRPKSAAMSLSTPSKRNFEEFESLSDNADHEEESPSNQLAREMSSADNREEHVYGKGGNADATAVEPVEIFAGIFGPVNTESPRKSKSHSITPVPYPAYVASVVGQFASSTAVPKLQRANSLATLSNADPMLPIERSTATIMKSNCDNFGGSKKVATPQVARDSTGSTPRRSTSGATKAQNPSKKPKLSKETDKKRKLPPPAKVADGDGQQDWEVERLEDVVVYDVEGRGLVRYFLVHWAGNWPADQQTSWEPEENIPPNMIRNFLKLDKETRAKRKLQAQKRKKKAQTSTAAAAAATDTKKQSWWGFERHYGSVSEAFEGNVEEGSIIGNPPGDGGEDERYDNHGIESEIFIVDEGLEAMSTKTNIASTFAF